MTTNTALRNSIISILFLIPFVPLIVTGALYFPYITGKAFAFRILIEVALILYIILIVRDRSYLPKKSPLLWSLVGFVAVMGLATIFSKVPARSFWSDYERMEGYVTVLHLCAYFVLLAGAFTRKTWTWFAHTSLVASIIIGLYGFADGQVRIAGTLGNSSYLGVYALLHTFIAAYFLLQSVIKKTKASALPYIVGYLILIVFNMSVLYRTGTRGAFLGLLIGGAVTAVLLAIFERSHKTLRYVGISLIGLLIIFVGALGLAKNTAVVQDSSLLSRFAALATFDVKSVLKNEGYARTIIWSMAWNGFKDRPVLGWGQDNFNYVFAKHYDPRMYSQEQWFDRSHNVFLDWMIAGGALGLLGYLSLFGAMLYLLWRKHPHAHKGAHVDPWELREKAVFTGLLVAYFIHNLFVFDNLVSYLVFFALLAYIQQRSTNYINDKVDHRPLIHGQGAQMLASSVAGILIIGSLYIGVIKPYAEGVYLIKALQSNNGGVDSDGNKVLGDNKVTLEYLQKTFDQNTFGSSEARERLTEVVSDIVVNQVSNPNHDPVVVTELTTLVKEQYEQQFKETPDDPRYYLFYGMYLLRIGEQDDAIKNLTKALELSPNKQSFLFQVGIAHFQKGDYQSALTYMKKAYDLDNSYTEALSLYATTLIYAGKSDEAEKELASAEARGSGIKGFDQRVLQAYLDTKQFKRLERIIGNAISEDPTNGQYYVSLAAVYLKGGNNSAAIAQIRKAMEVEPAFKDQGEFYIKEIQAGRDPSEGN